MRRILYISPGPQLPPKETSHDRFYYLSEALSGDILMPVWGREFRHKLCPDGDNSFNCRAFTYYFLFNFGCPLVLKFFWDIAFYLIKGCRLSRSKGPYDVVISYGMTKTGLAGWLLSCILRRKFIVEVPGNPQSGFKFMHSTQTFLSHLRNNISRLIAKFVISRADHVRLLYPTQLDGFLSIPAERISVFHEFVQVSSIIPNEGQKNFVLFLGYPWYLKGVDLLIKAFLLIADEFPEHELRVVGYCPKPDRDFFEELAQNHPRIKLLPPVEREDAIELNRQCSVFVLPSRTEAMGRVILEAWAARRPVITSDVDGLPHYVSAEKDGLLFPSEDFEALARQLRRVLSDPNLARSLGEAGEQKVRSELSEERYVNNFKNMIETVCL